MSTILENHTTRGIHLASKLIGRKLSVIDLTENRVARQLGWKNDVTIKIYRDGTPAVFSSIEQKTSCSLRHDCLKTHDQKFLLK
jgi:hypothetical protein